MTGASDTKMYEFQTRGGSDFFEKTLGRMVKTARSHKRPKKYRWSIVSELTMHGSTWSIDLCNYYGVDPFEMR